MHCTIVEKIRKSFFNRRKAQLNQYYAVSMLPHSCNTWMTRLSEVEKLEL